MHFGRLVKRERQARALSLMDVGDRCGVQPGLLSEIESGAVIPSEPLLSRLATALECDPAAVSLAAGLIPTPLRDAIASDPHHFAAQLRELVEQAQASLTPRCIEGDIPVETLSQVAELESWRKEIHRPIYHTHKWWAQRLGSVFRAIILASVLPEGASLMQAFYRKHDLRGITVFDPFAGSGTTLGEALKLGCRVVGRDINPVATRAVATALGPVQRDAVEAEYQRIEAAVGERLRDLYRGVDRNGDACDVLYHFWVKTLGCPACARSVDLFNSYIFARHAYPSKHPEVSIVCPDCGGVFRGDVREPTATCPDCSNGFDPHHGPARRTTAVCRACSHEFKIAQAARDQGRAGHRQYAKLVVDAKGNKDYLPATERDRADYRAAERALADSDFPVPDLEIAPGHNTKQVLNYGYSNWVEFFNARQLLGLSVLGRAITEIEVEGVRDVFANLFSGALEFHNMFASFKGEGTGAVRHMFSHHILKPERTPLEANLWGTPKSSGSWSGLYRGRVLRAADYKLDPTEIRPEPGSATRPRAVKVGGINQPISATIVRAWPEHGLEPGHAYISCGDSAATDLPDRSIDLVITDPPFFDNVHYSELADFFHAWQQALFEGGATDSTRSPAEVQDADPERFADKLGGVFAECHRVLVDDGLLVFSYHHSREDGWRSLAHALCLADFSVVAAHPLKAEMSVATPKSRTREPIDVDSILVCRKRAADRRAMERRDRAMVATTARAHDLLMRFDATGRRLSRGDLRVIIMGELLTRLSAGRTETQLLHELDTSAAMVDEMITRFSRRGRGQLSLL